MNKKTFFLLLSITATTLYGADTDSLIDLEDEPEDILAEKKLCEELNSINSNNDDPVRSVSRTFSSLSFENTPKDEYEKTKKG